MTAFTIVGAGGIGTAVGVLLQAGGHAVTLVTRTGADAEEINARGARAIGCVDLEVRLRALAGEVALETDDVLVLGVKAHQTEEALERVTGAPRVALTLQNGIEKEEPLIERFGAARVLPSVVQVTATLQAPGRTRCASIATSAVSVMDETALEAASDVAAAFTASRMPTLVVVDAQAVEWAKAAQWLPSSLLTAATGMTLDAVLRDEWLAVIYVTIARECAEVARRHGVEVGRFPELYAREIIDGSLAAGVERLNRIGDTMRSSELGGYRTAMELDLARGRPPELDPTAGAVLRAAHAAGTACPALETARAIVQARASAATTVDRAPCA